MTSTEIQDRPSHATIFHENRSSAANEPQIVALGAELVRSLKRQGAVWNPRSWPQRVSELVLANAALKAQLFRWVDVLPSLDDPTDIAEHLYAYLAEAGPAVPWPIRAAVKAMPADGTLARLGARFGRWTTEQMAAQFIAGENPATAWRSIEKLRRRGLAFTADLLGEAVVTEAEADTYRDTCLRLIRDLCGELAHQAEIPIIDRDDRGPIPRMNLSLKLSSLTADFDPMDRSGTLDRVGGRLRPILDEAIRLGAHIHFDMEQFAYKGLTFEIIRSILDEPAYRSYPHFGFVSQAYLIDSASDLETMRDWAARRPVPVTVRLVKGAYWDYEVTHARAAGWPVPVWTRKWQSDANYERLTDFLVANRRVLKPAFASHNARSLSHAIVAARSAGLSDDAFEIQTLYGMGDALQRALSRQGFRVRVYTPYGAILPGMAYLVRRLLENTSNDSFLKAAESSRTSAGSLLEPPGKGHDMTVLTRAGSWVGQLLDGERSRAATDAEASLAQPFANEPYVDFTVPEIEDAMKAALEKADQACGKEYRLEIAGVPAADREWLASYDPSHRSRLVARFERATAADTRAAIGAACAEFDSWKRVSPRERALCLERTALHLRKQKFELAARIVLEVAKPWKEADADVAEAIDFCRYYAREALKSAEQPWRGDVPGETNMLVAEPRGVVGVIGPWNFPLAIPLGMTAAALVTGNVAVVKPAEQSTWIASEFVRILHESGVPRNAVILVPGDAEAGSAIVDDPRTAMIVFTGSREVGVSINRTATTMAPGQRHVKKVAAEMGGKNAIIVDDDADLDDAVVGVLASAFGYSGQKCSACSRAIVHESVYEAFTARLAEAAKSLVIGPARDPATAVGPLVEAESVRRYGRYAEMARRDGRILAEIPVPEALRATGHFVSPLIVDGVDPHHPLAQEEIFAPILTVLRVADFEEALKVANDVDYALTGAVYSRDPRHLDRARAEFLVGNLYLNRGSTGAMVGRQPFGGMKMSGIGAKTGGPHYLDQFVNFRTLTENTMRRGFTPESLEAHEGIDA
jgi:RHH-type proline utilization regulon transcriptional repressor/proline dehydrogenase/delta 1-pyrroline-5-carboxylate dehydrogenase